VNAITDPLGPFRPVAEHISAAVIEQVKAMLDERLPVASAEPDRLIRVDEACELLGIKQRTLDAWQHRPGFPPNRSMGGVRRWSRNEIIAYRDASCKAKSAALR
jgi:predicted DNA-binding transcriptional regulator AlpA